MIEAGQNIFDAVPSQEEKDTESSTEESSTSNKETPTGQEGESSEIPKDLDGKTPLHLDARFRRVIDERNRLRRELEDARRNSRPGQATEQKTTASSQKPAWFSKYFGDDNEAWDGFQQMTASAREQAKAEAVAELRREQQESSQQSERWTSWVNEQVEGLIEEGESFDKNALFKVMDYFHPEDDRGNLDFRKGLEILRLKTEKPSNVAEKRQAGAKATGGTKSSSEPTKKNYVTSSDIRKMRLSGEI